MPTEPEVVPLADPDRDVAAEPSQGAVSASAGTAPLAPDDANAANALSAARVARIRAALLSGNYRVDLDKLAETIVKNGMSRTGAGDPDL